MTAPSSSRRQGVLAACLLALGALAPAFAEAPAVHAAPADAASTREARPVPSEVPAREPSVVTGAVETRRFRILYTAKSEGSARALAERMESVRDEFQKVIGRDWPGVTEIRVALGREELEALALPGGKPPGWAEALAYPGRNIILFDALSLLKPTGEQTLRHELSHVALGQLGRDWPRWFQEGLAMYLTGDRVSFTQYAAMFRAVTQDRLFAFEDLIEAWPPHPGDVEIAYAQSVVFVTHLVDRYGAEKVGELVDHVQGGAPFEVAFARAFRSTLRVEQGAWEETLPSRYSWMPIVTGSTAFWGFAALLAVVAWVRRRRTRAVRLAEMAAQDAAEDAALKLARAMQQAPAAVDAPNDWSGWPPPGADDGPGGDHPDDFPGHADPVGGGARDEASAGEEDEGEDASDPRKPRRVLH